MQPATPPRVCVFCCRVELRGDDGRSHAERHEERLPASSRQERFGLFRWLLRVVLDWCRAWSMESVLGKATVTARDVRTLHRPNQRLETKPSDENEMRIAAVGRWRLHGSVHHRHGACDRVLWSIGTHHWHRRHAMLCAIIPRDASKFIHSQ